MNLEKVLEYKKVIIPLLLVVVFLIFKLISSNSDDTENIVNPYSNLEVGQDLSKMLEEEKQEDYSNMYLNSLKPKVSSIEEEQKKLASMSKNKDKEIEEMKQQIKYLIENKNNNSSSNAVTNNAPFGMPVTGNLNNQNQAQNNFSFLGNNEVENNNQPIVIAKVVEWNNGVVEKKKPSNEDELTKVNNNNSNDNQSSQNSNESGEIKEKFNWLPSGTLFMVRLDNGTLNPTLSSGLGKSFSQATSVIVTEAFLPNGYKYNLRGAKVLFESKGNLATERADYRTRRISAVKPNGEMMDIPLQGFVSDVKTGMQGIAGRPVSKQEALFWGAVKAYAMGNIGKSLQDSANDVSTNSLGTVTSINTKNVSENIGLGVLGGAGQGMQEVGKNVLKIAQSTETVIENLAGQYAIVHLVEPLKLQWEIQETAQEQISLNQKNPRGGINNVYQQINN